MKVRLSSKAQGDIADIALTYRVMSAKAARNFVARVDATIERLRSYPRIGAPRDDLNKGLRSIPLQTYPHVLFYIAGNDEVVVTRVIDGRRDLKALLNDE